MKRLIAAAITMTAGLVAACVSVPPFKGQELISYHDDTTGDTGATVEGSGFKLHFAGGAGFHFPDALMIGEIDVMGHSSSPCWGESGTGFVAVPLPRISADGGSPAITDQVQAVLTGPAVVQVKLDWATRWTIQFNPSGPACSRSQAHTPGGSSTYTVFPDGRIVRHDKLTDPNPDHEDLNPGDCVCGDPPLPLSDVFLMSSYWAFARSRFPGLLGLGNNGDPTMPDHVTIPPPGSNQTNYSTMCLDGVDSKYQVASVWVVPEVMAGAPPPGPVMFGYDTLLAHDLQKQSSSKLEFPWDIHGALFVESAGCATAFKRAIAYTAAPPIAINGTPAPLSVLDGMYGGDMGDGKPGVDLPDGHAMLTGLKSGPQTGPFVVWLRFPGAVIVPVATRAGATGSWYVPQRVDDRNWILWFRDALQDGEMIKVDPD